MKFLLLLCHTDENYKRGLNKMSAHLICKQNADEWQLENFLKLQLGQRTLYKIIYKVDSTLKLDPDYLLVEKSKDGKALKIIDHFIINATAQIEKEYIVKAIFELLGNNCDCIFMEFKVGCNPPDIIVNYYDFEIIGRCRTEDGISCAISSYGINYHHNNMLEYCTELYDNFEKW